MPTDMHKALQWICLVLLVCLILLPMGISCKSKIESETESDSGFINEPNNNQFIAEPKAPVIKPESKVEKITDTVPYIYGVYLDGEGTPVWHRELCTMEKEDISKGLAPRQPDLTDMILIPAGPAIIGSNPPIQDVSNSLDFQEKYIDTYYIDKNEVTNDLYALCVKEKQCLPLLPGNFNYQDKKTGQSLSYPTELPNHPAIATFIQANRYCLWAGKHLPDEYQWEKAARGTDGRRHSWGNTVPKQKYANICSKNCIMDYADESWEDDYAFTSPVGNFPEGKSPFGLNDVTGNVREWVDSDQPLEKDNFVARGSSWYSPRGELYVFYRHIWHPGVRLDDKGFRCAVDVK